MAGMWKNGFVIAMAAEFSFAAYHRPISIRRKTRRWIIVSRCGPGSEFITIASAAGRVEPHADAPIGLAPINTAVGILLSQTAEDLTFLMVRQPPTHFPIAGAFLPTDGYCRIFESQGSFRLRSEGRHAHGARRPDSHVRSDLPDPAPNARRALGWHIEAVKHNWVGEFIS
ncbi:hypothetical protein PMI42_04363 [Bradyrhizobium sp. YR681]|uniref:hypothetical protein n=1 Tax=Bradyrhizobium sp. YR681 TaxID=1144344 RepID=UPI0002712ACF|nr:hypothetical protein [Bradyrhizobium sp. YR681]EJN12232.1 hypothetical protein PMI42_04363 [Bradyrhizobium sp. YR681]